MVSAAISIMLSSTLKVGTLTDTDVPCIVRLPLIKTSPEIVPPDDEYFVLDKLKDEFACVKAALT